MKFKLVYIVHGLILILFISSIVFDIRRFKDYFAFDQMTWSSLFYSGIFRTTLFLILPTLGVFIKNYKGWIFICQYFYFIVFLFMLMFDDAIFIERLLIALIPLVFILFMNYEKNQKYYNINKGELLKMNFLSSAVGFVFLILLLIIKDYNYF
ncbi:MAG: hypothetical protein ACI83H_000316 [Glaciecola sp.]|jgi:hypothetical protein